MDDYKLVRSTMTLMSDRDRDVTAAVERLMIAAERGRLPDPDYVLDDEADDE